MLANVLTGLGIDDYFARTDVPAATTSHFFPDALGSALALADAAGTVQTEYTYEPFGRTTVTGVSNTNLLQYTGRENDGTGLYYYRARYYNPQLQRFIAEDPILLPLYSLASVFTAGLKACYGTLSPFISRNVSGGNPPNPYLYVDNKPLVFSDPTGLDKCEGEITTVYTECGSWQCARAVPPLAYPQICFRVCVCLDQECGKTVGVRVCSQWGFKVPPGLSPNA